MPASHAGGALGGSSGQNRQAIVSVSTMMSLMSSKDDQAIVSQWIRRKTSIHLQYLPANPSFCNVRTNSQPMPKLTSTFMNTGA